MSPLIVFKAAARTVTETSSVQDIKQATNLLAMLIITAASGTTPTLNVKFQESIDGETWIDIPSAAFAQQTGAATLRLELASRAPYVRAVAAIGGTTPSFTFAVQLFGKL